MVSDGLSMINMQMSATSFRLDESKIGDNNFLGNAISYPPNGRTGTNVLFGSMTMVPIDGPVRENVGLLGSPAFEIPRMVNRDRDTNASFDEQTRLARLRRKNAYNFVSALIFLASHWIMVFAALVLFQPHSRATIVSASSRSSQPVWRSPPPTWPSSSCSSARSWASSDSSRSSPRSTIRISGCTKGSGSYRLSRS